MATNLEVGEYKNIGEKTYVAPSLNFMFVPSNQNKHAVAKCCAQLGRCLRADVSYFLCCTGKRDVCVTPSLIVFQRPAGRVFYFA